MKVKKTHYQLNIPLGIDKEFEYLFSSKDSYTYTERSSIKLTKCFVSNTGVIIHKGFIPRYSAENLIGLKDETFYLRHWFKATEQKMVCNYGNSLNAFRLEDKKEYFSIHTPWFGYFTWITSYLPRLKQALVEHPNAYLIYPMEWDEIPYVVDSLKLFDGINIQKIPKDHHVFVKNYILIPCRPWTSFFDSGILNNIRKFFHGKIDLINVERPKEMVFLSRQLCKRRKLINEEDIYPLLQRFNIKTVIMEELSFIEQVNLMYTSSLVISIHGAGLTNINFLNSGSTVIELTPKLNDFNKFRFPYWRMSELLKLNYYCIFCDKEADEVYEDEYDSNLLIDLKKMEEVLEMAILNLKVNIFR